jgi:hypothetical protein
MRIFKKSSTMIFLNWMQLIERAMAKILSSSAENLSVLAGSIASAPSLARIR